MTNTKKLNRLIEDSGLKLYYIAEQLNLSTYGLSRKINNKSEFKASEICKMSDLLNMTQEEVNQIFLTNE